ncbi:MAG TPA: glycosyltransferase family 39 protein [Dehalococcoidia bacterium]|nr:glycosyltransferase family 39 protein [Dehalococcoidia bacterium]
MEETRRPLSGTSLTEREATTSRVRASVTLFEGLFVTGAIVAFLAFTLPNLANFPGPTDDEIWILSASHKLATENVFGTDLFKGFWRADQVYLFNMPLHHIVLAAFFKVFGTSIFIARFVSVLYGIATIVLVYAFARYLRGATVACLSVVLLLTLRLHLAFDTGLPLQEMARSIRYDLAPVPFMLAGTLVLLRPTMLRCAIAGVLFSIATLLQFYGAFMFPVAAIYLLMEVGPLRERITLIAIVAITAVVVMAPYGVYVLTNYDEYKGQTSTLYRRQDLTDPQLYVENVKREEKRFRLHFGSLDEALTTQPSERAALFIAFPASLIYLAYVVRRTNRRGDRILLLSLALLPLQFLFLDFQKVTFYWIAVVPFLCIAIAITAEAAFQAVRPHLRSPARAGLRTLAMASVAGVLVFGFVAEGIYAQAEGLRHQKATNYMSLRPVLASYVPPGSKVLGATNLWWAMPDTDFRSYYMLYYRTNAQTTRDVTTVAGYLDEFGAEYVVLNFVARLFLPSVNPVLNQYLEERGEQIAYIPDRTFGFIEIWKINR